MVKNTCNYGYLMGIDLGTSNIKGALYQLDGKEIAFNKYDLFMPKKGIVENDVCKYWEMIKRIIQMLVKEINGNSEGIIAIGTSSQGETLVPVDIDGKPLRNAIVWMDSRSTVEAMEIRNNFDLFEMYKLTGQADVDTSWPATRIKWLKKNEPEVFDNTYKFLLLEDYIAFKFTGDFFGEASVYNSSYYYDIMNFRFISNMLDYLEISEGKLPIVNKPGTCIGNILEKCAEETGLSKKTKVILGAMDQICGAIGAGNIEEGIVTETTGSAFVMFVTSGKPIIDKEYNIPCALHAVPDTYALMPYSATGGMVLKWFKDTFCQFEEKIAQKENKDIYTILNEMALKAPPGCDGMIMIPHLCGALFPEYNYNARGVYFGIGINSSKSYFIRAILEAIAFMMKQDLDCIQKLGVNTNRLISIGGGAKSDIWCSIKADVCGIDIEVPESTETALLGAAILAAKGIGLLNDLRSACKNFTKVKYIYKSSQENKEVYEKNFKKYIELYRSIEKLF